MDKKTRPIYVMSKRDTPQNERYLRNGKRYFMQIEMKEKAGVVIVVSDKIDFKTKAVVRDKEKH